jgi:hypothetical protein
VILSSNVFGFPISAPSITLTDPAGLVTDAVTADVVTASVKVLTPQVVTPLVAPAGPTAGTGAAGTGLGLTAAAGANSAGTAGGKGGDLGLSAGAAGNGTAAANGGSVILRPGNGFAPGVSGLVRVENGPLVTSGGLVNLANGGFPAALDLTVSQLRAGLLYGDPGGAAVYNLPSANLIVQGFPGIKQNDIIRFSVANLSAANTIGIATAPPAVVGSPTIKPLTSGSFALVATNVSAGTEAFTLYRIS